MRYTPETRINNPSSEYVKLWSALDKLDLSYVKIGKLQDSDDSRENWTIPVIINDGSKFLGTIYTKAGIEFKENYYINGGGTSQKTKQVKQRLLSYCAENNIPVLLISRKKTQQEMSLSIRKWLDQLRKE